MKHLRISFYTKGFTVVELLVTIAIIGILSSVIYATFGDARAASRDDVRKTELKELQLAIELYKAQNGRYPEACNGPNTWSGNNPGAHLCSSGDEYVVGLMPDFIPRLPKDHNNANGRGFIYRVNTAGTAYKVLVNQTVEVKFVTSYTDEFARCPQSYSSSYCGAGAPQNNSYAVYSAGAENW